MSARLPALLAAGLVALALAACGTSASDGVTSGPDPSGPTTAPPTTTAPTTTTRPTEPTTLDPDAVTWQVTTGGGFLPSDVALSETPALTIYGDGRAFVPAPQPDDGPSRPGHAQPYEVGRVEPDALADLLAAGRSSGLLDERTDYGEPGITDMSSTTVTLDDGDHRAKVSVYALSYTDDGDIGLSRTARRHRDRLRDLIARSTKVVHGEAPWVPDRVEVREVQRTAGDGTPPVPWPASVHFVDVLVPATDGGPLGCATVTGADARRVSEADATADTQFWADGTDVRPLVIRTLLPGEAACHG